MASEKTGCERAFTRPQTVLVGLALIALAATAEYVEESLLKGALQSSTDPFPAVISEWDALLFVSVNIGLANAYWGWFFNILTRLGSTLFMFILSVLLYAMGRRREGILTFRSIVIGTLITLPIKLAVPRPRPFTAIPSAIIFDREPGSSFPSGHTMRAFALAFVASKLWPNLTIPLYIFSGLIAFSRIYLGQHYPSDVLAGAVIGLLVGYLTVKHEGKMAEIASRLGASLRKKPFKPPPVQTNSDAA